MKYSLKDFRRAAGQHVDDMEMSPAGRARLVKPIKRRRSPLTSIGWAAVKSEGDPLGFVEMQDKR